MAGYGQTPNESQQIQPVVMQQPKSGEVTAWLPNNNDGTHPLQYIQGVRLTQKISLTEMVTGFEKANRFNISDLSSSLLIGTFKEQSGCLERNFCKPIRSFNADIEHHSGHPLFKIERPMQCRCQLCCYTIGGGVGACCGNSMTISDRNGNHIGFIELQTSFACPFGATWLKISDVNKEVRFFMGGNLWAIGCGTGAGGMCGDKHVQLLDAARQPTSTIVKKWKGFAQEGFTDADVLELVFPSDANVNDKACLIAAMLLFDYLVFEKKE